MSDFHSPEDHLLFAMQFMQMLEDFKAIIHEDECPILEGIHACL